MYHLIDLCDCANKMKVMPDSPVAFMDREDAAIAAVTRNGYLVFQNRVFLRKHRIEFSEINRPNIKELLPDLWRGILELPERETVDRHRIIQLYSPDSNELIGHLLISLNKKSVRKHVPDFRRIVSEADHPDFVQSYCGLYVADACAYTLKVNPSYEKIAFLPESELVGRNLKELEEKGYFSQSVTLRVLSRLKREQEGSITLFQKIVSGKNVVVTGKPIYSVDRKLTHVLTFVQDLVPLKTIVSKCEMIESRESRSFPGLGSSSHSLTVQDTGKNGIYSLPYLHSLPFVARDPTFLSTLRQVATASKYDAPILFLGETGVGKDLLARYLHSLSREGSKTPFVTVNCAAIPKDLLESELFGYEEGAFSGARKGGKPGLFEEADNGILFLNEISETPLSLQTKLLMALDDGCIRRVGGNKVKHVRVRIICAANRDLFKCVEQGSFREDLYYRINVLTIQIPPLRKRPGDILPLIYYFMRKMSEKYGFSKFLSTAAQDILLAYPWPGNVRELKNLLERLIVFSTTDSISI